MARIIKCSKHGRQYAQGGKCPKCQQLKRMGLTLTRRKVKSAGEAYREAMFRG